MELCLPGSAPVSGLTKSGWVGRVRKGVATAGGQAVTEALCAFMRSASSAL